MKELSSREAGVPIVVPGFGIVNFHVRLCLIIGDTKGHDDMCGHYNSHSSNICRDSVSLNTKLVCAIHSLRSARPTQDSSLPFFIILIGAFESFPPVWYWRLPMCCLQSKSHPMHFPTAPRRQITLWLYLLDQHGWILGLI